MSNWVIIPYIDALTLTGNAVLDALAQDIGDVKVLAVAQGYKAETRRLMEALAQDHPALHNWFFDPPLLSLSAVWNRSLRMVWQTGATEAFVINNDLRLKTHTYRTLRNHLLLDKALFVSGVGVTQEQYEGSEPTVNDSKGGPDFSCFVISKECHDRFRFDENYQPAYVEDSDFHRQLMLAGEGHRIFSIDLPYWHVDQGSGTLKSMSIENRAVTERAISAGSRAYHLKKWGGPCNQERYRVPFSGEPEDGITNPELFDAVRKEWSK